MLTALLRALAAVSKATAPDHKALVDKVDCFIFDCDGALA